MNNVSTTGPPREAGTKEILGYVLAIIIILCLAFLGMSPKAGTFNGLDVFLVSLFLILIVVFIDLRLRIIEMNKTPSQNRVIQKITMQELLVRTVFRGKTTSDKLNLLGLNLLCLLPRRYVYKNPTLKRLTSALIEKTLIRERGYTWNLNHPSQFHLISGEHEKQIAPWFNMYGDTFIDIGSNLGKYTLTLSRRFGQVYSFEPCKDTYNLLCRNIKLNKCTNIYPLNIAGWDDRCSLPLFRRITPGLNSLLLKDALVGTEQVECWPLDNMDLDWGKIDLVKVDVEGAEYQVIHGMSELLMKHKPTLIIEIRPENQVTMNKLLRGLGFHLADKHDMNYLWRPIT